MSLTSQAQRWKLFLSILLLLVSGAKVTMKMYISGHLTIDAGSLLSKKPTMVGTD